MVLAYPKFGITDGASMSLFFILLVPESRSVLLSLRFQQLFQDERNCAGQSTAVILDSECPEEVFYVARMFWQANDCALTPRHLDAQFPKLMFVSH